MSNVSYFGRVGACAALVAGFGLAACSSDGGGDNDAVAQTVTVMAIDTTEGRLLSDIYALALEGNGYRVARRAPVADLPAAYAALKAGTADLIVTHTGDVLRYVAETEPASASTSTTAAPTTTIAATTTAPSTTATENTVGVSPETTTTTTIPDTSINAQISINKQAVLLGEILPDEIMQGAPARAENKNVIACAPGIVPKITSLSQLAEVSDTLRVAGPAEFETGDPFGLVGLERVYELTFEEFVPVEADTEGEAITPPTTTTTVPESTTTASSAAETSTTTTVPATTTTTTPEQALEAAREEQAKAKADCAAFNSLDPGISLDMVVMDDDLSLVETNAVLPLLTTSAYTPGVSQIINQVSGALSQVDLREMVRRVDVDGDPANAVAGQWVQLTGVITG